MPQAQESPPERVSFKSIISIFKNHKSFIFFIYRKRPSESQRTIEQFKLVCLQKWMDLVHENEDDAHAATDPLGESAAAELESSWVPEEANNCI